MITITLHNIMYNDGGECIASDKGVVGILVEGHAFTGKKGEDIVCAAVSTLSQTLIRAIDVLVNIPQQWEQRSGYLKTEIDRFYLNDGKKNYCLSC